MNYARAWQYGMRLEGWIFETIHITQLLKNIHKLLQKIGTAHPHLECRAVSPFGHKKYKTLQTVPSYTCWKSLTNQECWHHCSQLCYLCAGELLPFQYEEVWCNSWISSSLLLHIGHAVQRSFLHSNLQPNVTEKACTLVQHNYEIWNVGV